MHPPCSSTRNVKDKHNNNFSSYPSNNCFAHTNQGTDNRAQEMFPSYLNHSATVALVNPYRNSAQVAQDAGKPLLMIETNSASCGGFPGLSDSFGAALWALDYSLQMACSNFSGAMFHVSGPNSSYNVRLRLSSMYISCANRWLRPLPVRTLHGSASSGAHR
jgi:hypothetical protein